MVQRGLLLGSVCLVCRVSILAEGRPRRVAADRRVRVVRRQLPHHRRRALAGVVRVGLGLADVPDGVPDAGEVDQEDRWRVSHSVSPFFSASRSLAQRSIQAKTTATLSPFSHSSEQNSGSCVVGWRSAISTPQWRHFIGRIFPLSAAAAQYPTPTDHARHSRATRATLGGS